MVLLPHEVSESDDGPFDVAMRYGIRLSDLYAANQRQLGAPWQGWNVGSVIQIPFGAHPETGQSFHACQVADGENLWDITIRSIAACPHWNSFHVTPQFLWNHFRNRSFRRAQARRNGSPDNLRAVTEPLMLPYPGVNFVPANTAPQSRIALLVPPPDPPWWSPLVGLPPPLVDTLYRSWIARRANRPLPVGLLPKVLENTDWRPWDRRLRRTPGERHSTWWTMFEDFPLHEQNIVVRVFERLQRAAPSLWSEVLLILSTWCDSSAGFGFVAARDVAATGAAVSAEQAFVRDDTWGAAEHQRTSGFRFVTRFFNDSDAHTYREIVPDGGQGLHFCVGVTDPNHTNLHIDWVDPCDGRDSSGRAEYCSASIPHLLQVKLGIGYPDSPLRRLEVYIPTVLQAVLALRRSTRLIDDQLRDQVTFCSANLAHWAASGERGWTSAEAALTTLQNALDAVRRQDGPGLQLAMNNVRVSEPQLLGLW